MIKASNNPFECTPAIVNSGASSFNKTLQYTGATITVPTGFSGTIYNASATLFCDYTVVATTLTIDSNASTDDILIITSN